ncbi:recombinase family protein [Arthrobacter sp. SLBN-100]|nr:recombinase family protein [Arthrobacter sp. SLBN-100]
MLRSTRDGDGVVVHSMNPLARSLGDLWLIVQTLPSKGVCVEFV